MTLSVKLFFFGSFFTFVQVNGSPNAFDTTVKSLFDKNFENFEAFDVSTLRHGDHEQSKRSDLHEFRRSVSKMSNLAFAAFGKDYKMRIFKPKPVFTS